MSRPAVLRWSRSFGRCAWTGLLGALGIVAAVIGGILALSGSGAGLAVLVGGVLALVLSEVAARRYRQVTTSGLRRQRSWSTEEYAWQQIGLSTREPVETEPDAPDRITVHHRGGTFVWPEPVQHGRCVREIAWWQRAQREFPYGEFRAFPGLFPNMPKAPTTRRLHNPGRRVWQAILAVLGTVTTAALLVVAVGAGEPVTRVAALVAAGLAGAGGWVSLRNATSRVWVHPDRIEQRRWFARRSVPFEQIAGSYVLKRPYVVGLGFLAVIGVVMSLFSSVTDSVTDEVNNQQVPTLLLRDGTAVPLRALTSRSAERANKAAVALVDPGITHVPAPPAPGPEPYRPAAHPPQQSSHPRPPGW